MKSDVRPRRPKAATSVCCVPLLCIVLSACGGGDGTSISPLAMAPPATAGDGTAAPVPPIAPAVVPPSLEGIEYLDIAGLSEKMAQGATSRDMATYLLARIDALDKKGPAVNAVIELNPDAMAIADQLDAERASGKSRGPLHGIPVFLKDNIDTGDRMQTAAGSLALVGEPAPQDAFVAKKLREAGALILGKTNLSELSGFRSLFLPSGWSGRGGQTLNAHVLDGEPCGSSAGSAVAVAAGFVPIAIGTETDGSILCPAAMNGIVGIRPTLGLVSRTGVVPIASIQDTPGPMARTVRDAALLLSAMAAADPKDTATADAQAHAVDFTKFLSPDGLKGKRIGYAPGLYATADFYPDFMGALDTLRRLGATVVTVESPNESEVDEWTLLTYYFGRELNAYLATRTGLPVKNIEELQAFNKTTPLRPDGTPYSQWWIDQAVALLGPPTVPYEQLAREQKARVAGEFDRILSSNGLDALVSPGRSGAMAGYPGITVPMGIDSSGMPVAIYFVGTRWSEPTLLSIAYGFEQATKARRNPQFRKNAPVP
jgi:amidase